jgi:hypothetical protein
MTTTKKIPFTLEAWKAGGKPVTRSGDPVYDLVHMPNIEDNYKIIGVHDAELATWLENGNLFMHRDSDHDLFLEVTDLTVPEVAYGIIQRNPSSDQRPACLWSYYYDTAESAEYHANWLISERALAIVKITKIKDL